MISNECALFLAEKALGGGGREPYANPLYMYTIYIHIIYYYSWPKDQSLVLHGHTVDKEQNPNERLARYILSKCILDLKKKP